MFDAGAVMGKMGMDVSGFAGGMLQAQGIASAFPGVVATFIANPLLGVIDLAGNVASAIGDMFKSFLFDGTKLAADFEQVSLAMEVMLGSGEKAKKLMGELADFAAETPFEMAGLADAARQLVVAGVDSENVVETLRKLGDVASGVGTPIEELAVIYRKAATAQTLFTNDLDMWLDRGIPLAREFAEQMGVSESQVRKMASSGSISFDMLNKALTDMTGEGGKFFNMMERQSKTLNGMWSTVSDGWNKLKQTFAEGLLGSIDAKSGLGGLTELLASMVEPVKILGTALGEALAPLLKDLVSWVSDNKENLGAMFTDWAKQVGEMTASVVELIRALGSLASAASPLLNIGSKIMGFQASLTSTAFNAIGGVAKMVTNPGMPIQEAFGGSAGGSGSAGTTVNNRNEYNAHITVENNGITPAMREAAEELGRQWKAQQGMEASRRTGLGL